MIYVILLSFHWLTLSVHNLFFEIILFYLEILGSFEIKNLRNHFTIKYLISN